MRTSKKTLLYSDILMKRINKKYRNLTRFSKVSGVPYFKLYSAVKKGDKAIVGIMASNPDRPIEGEIDERLLERITNRMPAGSEERKQFCRENGILGYWLDQLLDGQIIFINGRVKRLLSILNIKP